MVDVPLCGDAGPPCRGQIEWCGEMHFLTKFTQAYPPAMCMTYSQIVKGGELLWELAKSSNDPTPMLEIDMGNPMKVGPVSRRHWMTCVVEDTWEDLIPQDEETSSTASGEIVDGGEEEERSLGGSDIWEFVSDGGGCPKGLSEGEHYEWCQGCMHPSEVETETMAHVPSNFSG